MTTPRILFIARAYPPTLGGMEAFALHLADGLTSGTRVRRIVNQHGKRSLPLFLPWALAAATRAGRRDDIDVIHLADALLAPVGVALRSMTRKPVTVSVHGLDVTYPNRVYQAVIPRALERLDMTMPNSTATEDAMLQRAPRAKSTVIPLGVNPVARPSEVDIKRFREACGGGRIVLTVGRLVRRKGVAWFAEHVLRSLPADVVYVVAGDGTDAERARVVASAERAGVSSRLRILGRIDDGMLAAAYEEADVFVMPNIPIAGDMEGFGLVALEASASGVPVIAAALEGIEEAVRDGQNGFLVPPGAAQTFADRINHVLALPLARRRALGAEMAQCTRAQYGWERASRRYLEVLTDITLRHRWKSTERPARVSS